MGLTTSLSLIRRGEPVIEGVPNRVFEQIDGNVRYLASLIEASRIGSTIYARRVAVEPDALVGMPVYYRSGAGRFELAALGTAADATTGVIRVADSAKVWGVVATKHGATVADLLLYGYAPLNISAATGGVTTAGDYFLGAAPGQLTLNKPPVAVPVLRADGSGFVLVCPAYIDFIDRHVHRRFDLVCRPAGAVTPPLPGERHVITAADPSLTGWLPATDASFAGTAPPGAVFGYNLAADPQLLAAWPPLPASGATLTWDKGLSADVSGTVVPLGPDGLAVIDRNGIWWLSDCYGDVPWPVGTDSSAPTSQSDATGAECPRQLRMGLVLFFSRPEFATDLSAVTSLKSRDERLKVFCRGADTLGSAGDLDFDLDLALTITDENALGGQALKGLTGGNSFTRGWVCEGLYAVSGNISLASPHTRRLVPDDLTTPLLYQGPVGISVAAKAELELPVDLYRLDEVNQEYLFELMYLSMPAGQTTSLRAKVQAPHASELASPQLSLRLRVLGRAVGSLPQLLVTARRVPRNSQPLLPLPLPNSALEFPVSVVTVATLTAANQYVEFESEPFVVADGDLVFFTVQRGDDDGYNGDVGVLAITCHLSSAEA